MWIGSIDKKTANINKKHKHWKSANNNQFGQA